MGGINFPGVRTTKGTNGTSFMDILALLAGEGSGLMVGLEEKGEYAPGWIQNKAPLAASSEASSLNTTGASMIPVLLTGPATNSFLQPVHREGLDLTPSGAPGEITAANSALSAEGSALPAGGDAGRGLSLLQELMPSPGMGPDSFEVLRETGSEGLRNMRATAFLNRLMSALKEGGLTSLEARQVEQMLTSLTVETQGIPSSETRILQAAQALLVRMGVNTQVMEEAAGFGPVSPGTEQNIGVEATLRSSGAFGETQKAGFTGGREPADLLKAVTNPEQALGMGKNSSDTENGALAQRAAKPGEAHGRAVALNFSENSQKVGFPGMKGTPGEKALPGTAGEASGSAMTPNDILKGSLHQAVQGAVLRAGSDDAGDDMVGRNGTGTGGSRFDGTDGIAAGAGVGKASTADGSHFDQQLSRARGFEVTTQRVMDQIVSGARIQIERGRTSAKIFLEPPALGKVNLHIVTKDDQVRIAFFAETTQVKEIIESNLSQLRQAFSEQGLRTDHFDVFVGQHQAGNQAWHSRSFDAPEIPGASGGERAGADPALRHERQKISGNNIVDVFI